MRPNQGVLQLSLFGARNNNQNLSFAEFCAGIGGFRLGLEKLGLKCVYSCEIDSKCALTYEANFGDYFNSRDITKAIPNTIPKHNIFCSGFPCQPFSIAGKRSGLLDERGDIFSHIISVLSHSKPEIIFLENVKHLVYHDKRRTFKMMLETLEDLGYFLKWQIINSKYYKVPQSRERVYIVGFKLKEWQERFEFPNNTKVDIVIKDILQENCIDLPISSRWLEYIDLYSGRKTLPQMSFAVPKTRVNLERFKVGVDLEDCVLQMRSSGIRAIPITEPFPVFAVSVSGGGAMIPVVVKERRHLNIIEIKRIMGFPDDFKFNVARTHAIKQLANAVCPPVITEIGKCILEAINI